MQAAFWQQFLTSALSSHQPFPLGWFVSRHTHRGVCRLATAVENGVRRSIRTAYNCVLGLECPMALRLWDGRVIGSYCRVRLDATGQRRWNAITSVLLGRCKRHAGRTACYGDLYHGWPNFREPSCGATMDGC